MTLASSKKSLRKTKSKKKAVLAYLTPNTHRQITMLSLELGMITNDLINLALMRFLNIPMNREILEQTGSLKRDEKVDPLEKIFSELGL